MVIAGAGGVARELRWLVHEINQRDDTYDLAGFVVSDSGRLGDTDSRDLVLGDYEWLERHRGEIDCLAIGIGNPASRRRVATDLKSFLPHITAVAAFAAAPLLVLRRLTLNTTVFVCLCLDRRRTVIL